MPNTKSARKRMRTSERRRQSNRTAKSGIQTARRRLYEAVAAGDRETSEQSYRRYCSLLDRAVKHGTLKPNNASRRKSRAARRIAAMA
jgi:small subunit ribosomal protein S20